MSTQTQGDPKETLDCVIPYIRKKKCVEFKPDTTKFTWEQERVSTKVVVLTDEAGKKTTRQEELTETKEMKVTLLTYGQTESEDCEHFFEAFQTMKHELEQVYKDTSKAKTNDASVLFRAFEKMVVGTAATEWHDVLLEDAKKTGRSWADFKQFVSTFITKKVLRQDDAYARQRQYMMERRMPHGMEVKEWWLRMQTMNRYLPYFMPSMDKLKKWFPNADFTNWWVDGGLSQQELKSIVTQRVPSNWAREFERVDVGHNLRDEKTTDELIDYFATLQRQERVPGGPTTRKGGQRVDARRNYQYNNLYGRASPGRVSPNMQGRVWPMQQGRVWPLPAGRLQTYYNYRPRALYPGQQQQQQGGRGGTTTSGRSNFGRSGRSGVQQSGRFGQRNQGFQGQQQGERQYSPQRTNPSTAYYQDEQDQDVQEMPYVETVPPDEAEADEQFAYQGEDEEELINRWNQAMYADDENLFMDAEESFEEYDEGYYGEEYL